MIFNRHVDFVKTIDTILHGIFLCIFLAALVFEIHSGVVAALRAELVSVLSF
jgi:hypothetical protein